MADVKSALPVYIVDDHDKVLPFIHRAIGSKRLPFSGTTIVHFDAHPDLLIEAHLKATDTFNKNHLYSSVSIATWLVPLLYAGHIKTVIWVKPPWAHQIPDGKCEFWVGECKETGYIKLTCTENYFLSESLYVSEEQLINKKFVTLFTVTVEPQEWPTSPTLNSDSEDSDCSFNSSSTNQEDQKSTTRSCPLFFTEQKTPKNIPQQLDLNSSENQTTIKINKSSSPINFTPELFAELGPTNDLILDIDLDFFSTKNPFLEVYTDRQYQLLKKLYEFTKPKDSSHEALKECVQSRSKQLQKLEQMFHILDKNPKAPIDQSIQRWDILEALVEDLQISADDVDYILVHDAGCTCDDTELPHHISTDAQIDILMQHTGTILSCLPQPTIITIARSSEDEYCPPVQVDAIQQSLLQMLTDHYPDIKMEKSYE
ncbi:UPF0489 protein C5orf22 homolog [Acanthosepion pharaonis]|uniref:UPF0489 protein C5orf22 homolog n=1 Tax=Acanthosepion pharaonis TaxID=158019 RepID=A0A812BF87_ACAPH|nr:UPF0489 protein C5orf22 homolog [Sepia pharaonis]